MVSTILESVQGLSADRDLRLIERFLAGDGEAFQQLYTAYYDRVFSIAKGVLIDPDDTADAVQEIFTQIYRNLHRFDRRSKFGTWVFRIAVNRSIQFARRHKYRSRQTDLYEAAATAVPEEMESADPKISEALGQLSPDDRAILTLFYWEELSIGQIAEGLGIRENAAKTRLYRARERFRAIYGGES